MDEYTFRFLDGSAGQAVLERLAAADLSESQTLALLTELRRDFPQNIAGAALTLARLRVRAQTKFSRADAMFFTRDALEQASNEIVSTWRAQRFKAWERVADLGCGIGGDTLALASVPSRDVIAVDHDPLRLQMARANLAAYGRTAHIVQVDLTERLPWTARAVPAAFFDPGRRAAGRRIFSVHDYFPPLDVITGWYFNLLAVKLSPGVNLHELQPYLQLGTTPGAGIEFVSLGGELKEAVLWRGESTVTGRYASRLEPDGTGATLLPQGILAPPLSAPRAYLYEPDPAVIRAGLFGELAEHVGVPLYRLDETIAYLTGDSLVASRWARVWPVWEWMPFNLKKLRAALRTRDIGRVTVKKRGSPITPEELMHKLKLDGNSDAAVVVLTQVAGQHSALICGEMIQF